MNDMNNLRLLYQNISKILLIASLKTFLTSLHLRQNSFLDTIHYTFKHRLLLIDVQ